MGTPAPGRGDSGVRRTQAAAPPLTHPVLQAEGLEGLEGSGLALRPPGTRHRHVLQAPRPSWEVEPADVAPESRPLPRGGDACVSPAVPASPPEGQLADRRHRLGHRLALSVVGRGGAWRPQGVRWPPAACAGGPDPRPRADPAGGWFPPRAHRARPWPQRGTRGRKSILFKKRVLLFCFEYERMSATHTLFQRENLFVRGRSQGGDPVRPEPPLGVSKWLLM